MGFVDSVATCALSSVLLVYLAEISELSFLKNYHTSPTIQYVSILLHWANNMISLFYAYFSLNWIIYVIQFLGLLLHTYFIWTCLRICGYKFQLVLQFLCTAVSVLAAILYFSPLKAEEKRESLLTFTTIFSGVAYVSNPLLSLRDAYRNSSNVFISIWLTSSFLWTSSLWFLYGFLIKDNILQIAYMPCIALSLGAMGFVWHIDKKKMDERNNKIKSDLESKSKKSD